MLARCLLDWFNDVKLSMDPRGMMGLNILIMMRYFLVQGINLVFYLNNHVLEMFILRPCNWDTK